MIERLLGIQAAYEALYTANAAAWPEVAPIYGWLAAASLVVALVTLLFVIFKREQARQFAALIGQHVLVVGVPWMVGPVEGLVNGLAAGESLPLLQAAVDLL